jgi:hypothetical protein
MTHLAERYLSELTLAYFSSVRLCSNRSPEFGRELTFGGNSRMILKRWGYICPHEDVS